MFFFSFFLPFPVYTTEVKDVSFILTALSIRYKLCTQPHRTDVPPHQDRRQLSDVRANDTTYTPSFSFEEDKETDNK